MNRKRNRDGETASTGRSLASTLRTASAAGSAAIVSVSFWTAVCLPALLLWLLLAGIDTPTRAGAFLAVAGIEVLALVVGRTYSTG